MSKVIEHSVTRQQIDINKLSADPAVVKRLMPDIEVYHHLLMIKDMEPEYANALRAAVRELVHHKALQMDDSTDNVVTNDQLILPPVLKQRVESIRISSKTPDSAVFTLAFKNTTKDIARVYSRNLTLVGDKNSQQNIQLAGYFSGWLNIHDLGIEKSLTIKKITVKPGQGYQHENFSLCTFCDFYCLDFVEVYQMKPYGQYETVLVDRKWYVDKSTRVDPQTRRADKKMLLVPKDMPVNATIERAKKNMKILRVDDPPLKSDSSKLTRWALMAETLEDVPIFRMGLEALIELLTTMKAVDEVLSQDEVLISLYGVSAVYGNAIMVMMFEDNPPMATIAQDSNDLDKCYLKIKAAEPRKLFDKAVEKLVVMYKKMLHEL